MKILFYRYGNICEPDIIATFTAFGLNVIEEKTEITNKKISPADCAQTVSDLITKHAPMFVFSINFYPVIARVCHIHNVLYLCWSVDCPVLELFTQEMKYPTNRIFLFDREQFNRLHPFHPDHTYYLPLAANTDRFDSVTQTITAKDKTLYSADISFVGSLYSEHNLLTNITDLSPYARGCIDGIVESSLKIYGYNFMEDAISDSLISDIKKVIPDFFTYDNLITNVEKYAFAHRYLGIYAAELERTRTLNKLAEHFTVDLYTGSDVTPLHGVRTHDRIESLYGMPKVFHLSKINLNMTIKPIQTGLPLRIFDIMGCGGFLMTNYQAELPEYFEIGKDLEAYSSLEELVDKCAYYLEHEEERKRIALQGYEAVKRFHTYPLRIAEMIRSVSSDS